MNDLTINVSQVAERIFFLRGQKVMLDFDLATLYLVETRVLKQQVKRNIDRFPSDFMFILTSDEIQIMVSQNVIPSRSHLGGAIPMAFTEQGVAMLSSVLKSQRAIKVNITIMRAFVQLRHFIESNKDLAKKIEDLELKYDKQFNVIFEVIKQLINKKDKPRKEVGYLAK
jgi:hypothetical protein